MVRSILITVLTIILIVESSTELDNEGDSDNSNEHDVKNKKRITILIEELLNLKKSDIFGLGNIHGTNDVPRDMIDDGINSSPLAPGLSLILCYI